jgi:hypothetical protein
MARKPDRTETREWKGRQVEVRIWCDQTDCEWDGDDPLEPGSTGWDQTVEVEVQFGDQRFTAGDSLCNSWINPGGESYLDEVVKEQLLPEALALLEKEISDVANGRGTRSAIARQTAAHRLCQELSVEVPPLPAVEKLTLLAILEREIASCEELTSYPPYTGKKVALMTSLRDHLRKGNEA